MKAQRKEQYHAATNEAQCSFCSNVVFIDDGHKFERYDAIEGHYDQSKCRPPIEVQFIIQNEDDNQKNSQTDNFGYQLLKFAEFGLVDCDSHNNQQQSNQYRHDIHRHEWHHQSYSQYR